MLVIAELALAVMLLAGAGLLIRSYVRLAHVAPGFEPQGVVTFSVSLPAARYSEPSALPAFANTLLSRLQNTPDVDSAAMAMGLPFTSDLNALTGFRRGGEPEVDSASMPSASLRITTAGYFKAMRIPIRFGRGFAREDTATAPEVALINQRTAQRYFAGVNPIGQRIWVSAELSRGARNGPKTIVGVVGNVKYGGLDEETPAEIYLPYDQHPVSAFTVAVRTRGDSRPLIPALRRTVAALDPSLPLANVSLLRDLIDQSTAVRRFTLLLFLTFGAIAVALSAIGVYGVLSYVVSQRRREVGVRVAIGASPADVVWLFVREGGVLILLGLAAGLAGALAGGRWISALLFGVTPADPVTLVSAVLTLGVTAACATALPARRAARLAPAEALRTE
jgi:putative ABC transport system permease protein